MGRFIQGASESSGVGDNLIAMGAFSIVMMILIALCSHLMSAKRGGYAPRLGGNKQSNSTSSRARTSSSVGNGPRIAAGYIFLLGALLITLFHDSYIAWMNDHVHLSSPMSYAVGCIGIAMLPIMTFFGVFYLLGGFSNDSPRR